ncbi:vitamin K epoxide reductase family protein [Salinibacterium sp. ZJ454]|uniref:vitamin K epoxide reductase family protein n=1 Tax=Salinibacterium sp. ZJ454 TaxID=2708339 RepID=UPI001FBB5027|nr:vitamin K epoxide reductase family protein [Salinibacterium sp. ZJ454]
MTLPRQQSKRIVGALLLILAGAVGLTASFILVLERIELLRNPQQSLSCDFNPFVSCGPVIQSWQGSLFGFPNPLIGVVAYVAPIAVGVGMLAGARFARWFWQLFLLGVFLGWVFIMWLFTQAVYSIGTLCVYCIVVWCVQIPLFWGLTVWSMREGHLGRGVRPLGRSTLPFTWMLVFANYAVILFAILAQFPLLLTYLF